MKRMLLQFYDCMSFYRLFLTNIVINWSTLKVQGNFSLLKEFVRYSSFLSSFLELEISLCFFINPDQPVLKLGFV